MAQDFGTPISPTPEPKKNSNTTLIIAIIVIIVLCCCCVLIGSGVWLWNNGDALLEQYGLMTHLLPV